jgi:uncharacterized protein YkwD
MSRERRASEHTDAEVTALERSVFEELNYARTRPRELAKHLQSMRPHFDGMLMKLPGRDVAVQTQEGVAALDEAIDYLNSAAPLPSFQRISAGMSRAARDHVRDSGRRGSIGHLGSDGSTLASRLDRHGEWRHSSGENINYFARNARDVVVQLIIDDGVPDRGHRTNIYKKDFNVVGIASGAHATHEFMVVVTFAGDFVEQGEKPPVTKVAMGGGGGSGGGSAGGGPVAAATKQMGGLSLQKPSAPLDKSDIPPGGKKEVKTEVSIVGNKKTTKVTTTITDPSGGKTTRVETKVETTS